MNFRSLLTFLIVASLGVIAAHAKIMKLPSDKSASASIDIPDSWNPEEITDGVTGERDGVILVVVAAHPLLALDLDDTFTMLKDHGVELDQSSKKVNESKINGHATKEMLFRGKDEHGGDPVSVSIILVSIQDKEIVLTHFGSPTDEEKHREEIDKIVKSVKPAS